MSAPLAHAGHWYHTLLYVAPVILIAAGLWWTGRAGAGGGSERSQDD